MSIHCPQGKVELPKMACKTLPNLAPACTSNPVWALHTSQNSKFLEVLPTSRQLHAPERLLALLPLPLLPHCLSS